MLARLASPSRTSWSTQIQHHYLRNNRHEDVSFNSRTFVPATSVHGTRHMSTTQRTLIQRVAEIDFQIDRWVCASTAILHHYARVNIDKSSACTKPYLDDASERAATRIEDGIIMGTYMRRGCTVAVSAAHAFVEARNIPSALGSGQSVHTYRSAGQR